MSNAVIRPLQPETLIFGNSGKTICRRVAKRKAAPSCRTRAAKGLKGVQVIPESSAKAQVPKAKKRQPDFARYIGKAMSAAADAGYVLKVALEKVPSTEPTGTSFEEWKRNRAD